MPGFVFAVKQPSVAFGWQNMGSSNFAVSLFVVPVKLCSVFNYKPSDYHKFDPKIINSLSVLHD